MKKALVIIDMQNGFMNKYTRPLIPKIKRLLKRKLFPHTIFTKFVNTPYSPYIKILSYAGMQKAPETSIVTELAPFAKNIFEKNSYSPFTPEFIKYVEKHKITSLYFVGVDTNACVLKGAIDTFEKGLTPIVLAQYCASHSGPNFHRGALIILKKLIGEQQVVEE